MRFSQNVIVIFTKTNLIIYEAWRQACRDVMGPSYRPMVTSGMDGAHSPESGHYHGRALDFRLHDIPEQHHEELARLTQALLGLDYLVLLEKDPLHCHIQRNKHTF